MRTLSGLKVCFVAGTLGNGGAERQLFYILRALRQEGASPHLFAMDRGGFWEERIKNLGVSVTCVGERPSRFARLLRLMKEARKFRPDVLQSQHFFTNAYVALAARFSGSSGIGAMRNNGSSEVSDTGSIGGWLSLHCPRRIAANSQVAIRYAVDCGVSASRLFFLPNVVDTHWFKPSTVSSNEPLTLVAVGRLVKQKRLDRFISILHRLRTELRLNLKGMIVGGGQSNELEKQARQLGLLPEDVQFLGSVSDMRSVYQQAAVCVLTSDHEGTPNVLLEAMACGLPVVSTNVGGVPDIVRHGESGFLFEPENLDGLVTALSELVKNPVLRTEMGKRARTFVERNHSLERLPAYLDNLYQLALPKGTDLPSRDFNYESV
jgi:glycosyltransferase involved in cell wall biosynthesis